MDYREDIYFDDLKMKNVAGEFSEVIMDKLFDNNKIKCFSTLFPTRFKSDFSFAAQNSPTALDNILKRYEMLDYVFFDSGELSSMVEWMKLKERIRVGGLAVFHDIYFPKSIKNFMVCAAICCSKNWEIIYQDKSTPQGLLVARKTSE